MRHLHQVPRFFINECFLIIITMTMTVIIIIIIMIIIIIIIINIMNERKTLYFSRVHNYSLIVVFRPRDVLKRSCLFLCSLVMNAYARRHLQETVLWGNITLQGLHWKNKTCKLKSSILKLSGVNYSNLNMIKY